MAQINFNVEEAPESDFEVIPAGSYAAHIIQSDMKETKAGTGMYLELRIQILDEEFQGRLVFERLNLVNPNETAVKIAQRQLAQLCKACGLLGEVEDSEELHNIPFTAVVGVQEAKGDFPASNTIKSYQEA